MTSNNIYNFVSSNNPLNHNLNEILMVRCLLQPDHGTPIWKASWAIGDWRNFHVRPILPSRARQELFTACLFDKQFEVSLNRNEISEVERTHNGDDWVCAATMEAAVGWCSIGIYFFSMRLCVIFIFGGWRLTMGIDMDRCTPHLGWMKRWVEAVESAGCHFSPVIW